MSFSDKPDKLKKIDVLNKDQRKLHRHITRGIDTSSFDLSQNPMFQRVGSFLQEMMDPSSEAYQRFEAPYLRQFKEQVLPQIEEKYSSLGLGRSSYLNKALAHAYSGLEESLASMRMQNMMNASQMGMNYSMAQPNLNAQLSQLAMGTPTFAYNNVKGQQGWGGPLIQGMLQTGGMIGGGIIGGMAGGPMGAMAGAQMGNAAGSSMGNVANRMIN
jgi:hypothetical protein